MTPVTVFAGRTVAVFGLGGSGLATAKALRDGNAEVVVWDDTTASVLAAEAQGLYAADLRTLDWAGVAALVLSPGVPLTHPEPHWTVALARAAGVEIIGDIELFARQRRATAPGSPLVAITGTNGKSTTTALIAHILRHAGRAVEMGGNIGTAALLLEPPSANRVHVLECSSYQIDLAPTLDATVGILLNLTEDHLDRHGTMDRYAAIKERLVAQSETAVVAVDDEFTRDAAERLAAAFHPLVLVSAQSELQDGIVLDGQALVRATSGRRQTLASLAGVGSLRGRHNAQNAAAAAAAAQALGLSDVEIAAGLASFPGLAHRMEQVGRRGPVLFVNDSKATNADAAAKALGSFEDIFWILGGKPKTGGIDGLKPLFPRVRKAYLIGEASDAFAATLAGEVAAEQAGTLERAVSLAAADAEASGLVAPVVLLSPACASFDQFRNFEVRGDAFRDLVKALP